MARPYTYFYNAQIKTYIHQFMRIFSGLQVQYGVDRDDPDADPDRRRVHVHYGDMERIVANVLHDDGGTFVANKIPIMSAYLTSVEVRPEDRRSKHHEENVRYVRESDSANMVTSRLMAVPYRGNLDLTLYASNSDQMFQMLEQIMLMFRPYLHIQKSSDVFDWSYITKAELVSINNEGNYPVGTDQRVIVQTLNFTVDFWLNYPKVEYDKVITQIITNVKDNTNDVNGVDLDSITITDTGWT